MHTLRISASLLLLPLLCLAGCASTTGVPSKAKTVASVGDKTFPVVTGEPGASVVADVETPQPSVRSKGRISGRVVDETGEPLPDVRVRLAVGNAPGGQVISATTDRTGAFTLNGVRAGSAHTVIAEWEDDQEYLTGRSVVNAPDTDVRITLAPSGTESKTASAPIRPNRISPVSEKSSPSDEDEELLDEEGIEVPRVSSRKPRVNVEDLPPAREAESYETPASARTPVGPAPAPSRVRWRRVGADGVTRREASPATESAASVGPALQDPETREVGIIASNSPEEGEGPNPLPPALEPGQASPARDLDSPPRTRKPKRSPSSGDDEDPLPPAREPGQMSVSEGARKKPRPPAQTPEVEPESEPASSETNPLPPALETGQEGDVSSAEANPLPPPELEPELATNSPAASDLASLPSAVEANQTATPEPASVPVEQQPPAATTDLLALSETVPSFLNDLPSPVEAAPSEVKPAADNLPAVGPPPGTNVFAAESPFETPNFDPAPSSAPAMAVAADQSIFEEGSDATPSAPPDTRKRPTWKDLASLAPKASPSPVDKSKGGASAGSSPIKPAAHAFLMEQPPAIQTSSRAAPTPTQADVGVAFCDYDAKHRKINDFRLPDLEGRPVRFQDLDADLVLIDFWGTWCQPCLRSVPHLVDLQKRMGPSKLKVVGIACEQGPRAERAKLVAQEVRRLGINYPVLLSGMDGPCPLQEALKVQAYPTLILVDRQGRIVWRDQGATPVTLARLDRILGDAMTSKSEGIRRY
ncbi:redoxin domain-containing protein [Singulisphaera sp. Ch08]|uniref:Redoxin domain-containing protein n=1 Tax=Singulisphaera sp. Ch08 TaxID=3120278 RepID=A0AAU7CQH4_9BACT